MPPLAKRAAPGGKLFDMGLVEELLDSTIDHSYSVGCPDDDPNDEADPDEEFSWAFSLLDKN